MLRIDCAGAYLNFFSSLSLSLSLCTAPSRNRTSLDSCTHIHVPIPYTHPTTVVALPASRADQLSCPSVKVAHILDQQIFSDINQSLK